MVLDDLVTPSPYRDVPFERIPVSLATRRVLTVALANLRVL